MSERKGTVVIIPCYRRIEYTSKCLASILHAQTYKDDVCFYLVDDGSNDGTSDLFAASDLPNKHIVTHKENQGLRSTLIDAFKFAQSFEFMVKMDNDCKVPKNWLNDIEGFLKSGWVDIVSPNVNPSNAAYTYGHKEETDEHGLRRSKIVGGLWAMRTELLDDITFEKHEVNGIKGAFHLLNQIILEKEPRVGWLSDVTVEDMGHHSGDHPENIQSEEHRAYSAEVGRNIQW